MHHLRQALIKKSPHLKCKHVISLFYVFVMLDNVINSKVQLYPYHTLNSLASGVMSLSMKDFFMFFINSKYVAVPFASGKLSRNKLITLGCVIFSTGLNFILSVVVRSEGNSPCWSLGNANSSSKCAREIVYVPKAKKF